MAWELDVTLVNIAVSEPMTGSFGVSSKFLHNYLGEWGVGPCTAAARLQNVLARARLLSTDPP
jgi:hypothetical protein